MNYNDWERGLPSTLTGDPLWKVTAYRLAVFVGEIAWHDTTKLMGDRRTLGLASQLYEAVGSVSANLAEGYSRGGTKDRARFYEYSLGSARESRDWYFKSRHILGEDIVTHRLGLLTEIIRLLLTMIPEQRGQIMHEAPGTYLMDATNEKEPQMISIAYLSDLLEIVPLPNP